MDIIKVESKKHLCRHWVRKAATIPCIWQPCDNNKNTRKAPCQQECLKYTTYGVRMSPECLDFNKRRLRVITGLTRQISDGSKLMRIWMAVKWKVWITTKFPASHLAEKKWQTTDLAFGKGNTLALWIRSRIFQAETWKSRWAQSKGWEPSQKTCQKLEVEAT